MFIHETSVWFSDSALTINLKLINTIIHEEMSLWEMRLKVDDEINESSAKSLFEILCSVDSIRALIKADWLSLSDLDQWDLWDSLSCIVYKC